MKKDIPSSLVPKYRVAFSSLVAVVSMMTLIAVAESAMYSLKYDNIGSIMPHYSMDTAHERINESIVGPRQIPRQFDDAGYYRCDNPLGNDFGRSVRQRNVLRVPGLPCLIIV